MTSRSAIRLYGKGPLRYQWIPGVGAPSSCYHTSYSIGQSVLRSYQKQNLFGKDASRRLAYYSLFAPGCLHPAVVIDAWRSHLKIPGKFQCTRNPDLSLLPRVMILSIALQGSGASGSRWTENLMQSIHSSPELTEAALILSSATQIASGWEAPSLDPDKVFEVLIEECVDEGFAALLAKAADQVAQRRSVRQWAKSNGWQRAIPNEPIAVVATAIYAWLRHLKRFRMTVEPVVQLGGNSAVLGAIAGGLSGMNLGARQIPPLWVDRLGAWPHGNSEVKEMATRLTDWPHGAEDLHRAPALPSRPVSQLIRNAFLLLTSAAHRTMRLPWSMAGKLMKE